jgi:pimeloyl-CoA dehydrogenase small subunit
LLKQSVERLLKDRYGFEQRKVHAREPEGWSRAAWRHYAELGLLGLPFAERHGGFGGGAVETMIVMEAMGRALILEPYLATIVLAGGLLRHAASDTQLAVLVPKITAGDVTLAFAHHEREARYDLADVTTRARRDGTGWVLDGDKSLVLQGDTADHLIVSARIAGERRERRGIVLFLVDGKARGVSRRPYPTQDGMRAAEISLASVRVGAADMLGELGAGLTVIERVADEAMAALAAEAVGAMSAVTELTVEYLKTRKQFGVAIGSFQVLQHRAAEMLIAVEQARSMALYATMMTGEDDAAERHKAVAAAKVQIGRSGKFVAQQATQLHGGIGMTMEYSAGHYLKRLTMIDFFLGDADHHLRTLAQGGGMF